MYVRRSFRGVEVTVNRNCTLAYRGSLAGLITVCPLRPLGRHQKHKYIKLAQVERVVLVMMLTMECGWHPCGDLRGTTRPT